MDQIFTPFGPLDGEVVAIRINTFGVLTPKIDATYQAEWEAKLYFIISVICQTQE